MADLEAGVHVSWKETYGVDVGFTQNPANVVHTMGSKRCQLTYMAVSNWRISYIMPKTSGAAYLRRSSPSTGRS